MNKFYCKSFAVAMCASAQVHAIERPPEKLSALDTDFLLFIAEMEQIEQQWFDPLAVEKLTLEQNPKSAQSNEISKNMNTSNTEKTPTKTDDKSPNKGVK